MLTPLLLLPLNRLLRGEAWASDMLREHSGKGAEIIVGTASLRVHVTEAGLLEALAKNAVPAVRIEVPASALGKLPDMDAVTRQAHISGDAGFAETIARLMRHLRPDVGAALSPFLGQALAHRVEQSASRLASAAQDSLQRLGANLREYASEGSSPAVSRNELVALQESTRQLDQTLARLESRVTKL